MGFFSALIPGADTTMGLFKLGADIYNSERGYHENRRNLDKSFEYSSALASQQHEFEKEKMQNAYQWTMEDIQNSGLNPTLMMQSTGNATVAGGSGGGTIPTPTAQPGQIDVASALKLSKELETLDSEKKRIDSETDMNEKNSGKIQAQTQFTLENIPLVKEQIKNTIENTNLTRIQKERAEVEIGYMLQQQEKIAHEIDILKQEKKTAEVRAKFAQAVEIQRQITGYLDTISRGISAIKGTSALPMTINGTSAVYHQPGYLWE